MNNGDRMSVLSEDPACYLDDQELDIKLEDYEHENPEPMNLKIRTVRFAE